MIDFLYGIDLIVMLILLLGFNLFASFHMFVKIVYIPLIIYFLFGIEIGVVWIEMIIQLMLYMIAIYVMYVKYLKVFHKEKIKMVRSK